MDDRVGAILARLPTYFQAESCLIIGGDEPTSFYNHIAAIFEGKEIYAVGDNAEGEIAVDTVSVAARKHKGKFDLVLIVMTRTAKHVADIMKSHLSKEGVGLVVYSGSDMVADLKKHMRKASSTTTDLVAAYYPLAKNDKVIIL